MRNPDWVRDEIILAMDLYLRAGRRQLAAGNEDVVRLSRLLNELPIHPLASRDENFRNPTGISMILGNFLGVDPLHSQAGLSRNNQLQESVWNDFIERPDQLRRAAEAIEHAAAAATDTGLGHTLSDEEIFPEGEILTRQHVTRERSRSVVAAKIEEVLGREGRLVCEVCAFDFLDFYGELGRGFAECHHVIPLAEAAFVRMTRLFDLAVVCANCHRMLHRGRPVLTIGELQNLLVRRYQPVHGGA
jgi:5-methylcytosine-specific restriction protein A